MKKNITDHYQMPLDAGQCPKCLSSLFLDKTNGNIACSICSLEIVDSYVSSGMVMKDIKESDVEDLNEQAGKMAYGNLTIIEEPKMRWQEAVTIIDKVIENWLTDPEPVGGDIEAEVRAAWQRMLQG